MPTPTWTIRMTERLWKAVLRWWTYCLWSANATSRSSFITSNVILFLDISRNAFNVYCFVLFLRDITNTPSDRVIMISEIANFYAAVIRAYPHRLETNDWDLIRIAVSSWVLTVSKSCESFQSSKVRIHLANVILFTSIIYKQFVFNRLQFLHWPYTNCSTPFIRLFCPKKRKAPRTCWAQWLKSGIIYLPRT